LDALAPHSDMQYNYCKLFLIKIQKNTPFHFYKEKMAMTTLKPFDRITVDPHVMNGRPCIRGMRLQVSLILNLIANGMSEEEIIKAYPSIESEDISQCLQYAAWLAEDRIEMLAEG
jgi:uncharacterized protein (DUF433 family)